MAKYDKGRYYWIKLTDRFMTSDTVDFLMSQKDGANYVVLYQMLCLKTVNNNGIMARQIGEFIVPYDIDKIQRDCKWFSMDTVRIALELYKKLGLIYENNDGILAISEFDRLIGSQTFGAEKKQLQRAEDECPPICPPDKEIKRIRDKDIDIDIDINIEKKENTKRKNSTSEYDDEFEIVWKLYPRKIGKSNARKSYTKARKEGVEFEVIKKGVENYAEYCRDKGTPEHYIAHGSSWFNDQRWNDDYNTPPKNDYSTYNFGKIL